MPYTTSADNTRIHYEIHGSGDPVLLIMGLGSNAYGWYRTIPWLSQKYLTIAFDNRGTGRSDAPLGAYSIAAMADDAAAVLDAAGYGSAHIVGASLGGMIAQRFAIQHPGRVATLVLVCTTPGGPNAVAASPDVMSAMIAGGDDPSTVYRRNAWFLYGESTRNHRPERIKEDLVYRNKIPTPPAGYFGQLQAAMAHDVWDDLPSIAAPTLVIHGDADLLVPTENGKRIAERIPGAKLILVPGAGHMLQSDADDAVREAFLEFLPSIGSPSRAVAQP